MLMIDTLATRYHKLPSEILDKATSLDYKVMDVSISYANYQRSIQETGRPPAPEITTEMLMALDEAGDKAVKERKKK